MSGVYKVPYQVCCEEGKEVYNEEKWKRGSIIIFPIVSRLMGRILSGERGGGNFGEDNQDFKISVWGRLSSFREL